MSAIAFLNLISSAPISDLHAVWAQLDNGARGEVARHRFVNGESALQVVAQRGLSALIESLVCAGAALDAKCAKHMTPLHAALRAGHDALAIRLLDKGADIDAYGARGLTMLHQAILSRQENAVGWLVSYGANPQLRVQDESLNEMNAFHLGAESTPAILRLLLQARSPGVNDVYYKKTVPFDTLRTALIAQREDMLDVLIGYGSNLSKVGADGMTPVQFLLCHRICMIESLPLLCRLLAAGADMQTYDALGETLLMLAVRTGWLQAFEYLLAVGVQPHVRCTNGTTLLHIAARGMHHDIFLKVLAVASQDIDARNHLGQTPLWLAAQHNRRENVKSLLHAGADPTIVDHKNRAPDMVCQSPLQRATRKLLLDALGTAPDVATPRRGARNIRNMRVSHIRNKRGRTGFDPSKPR